ncbi:hypothetical protein ABL78_4387 [Leptomonas seymouri]|uniref:Uncharacterized protein n=1 Tax=Leptomonas seymouri TaxID=5684 RepID=A0A0N1PE59_LEPSE|nr:hypothetical protein ABL78_4387 [Leptomonas seymouri]|eukprot:KPI86564.1 hypothetical protein ABL78_4387 [Leptomonas seymouri]
MPPPSRQRYHSSPRTADHSGQQRYTKKEDARHTSAKKSRSSTTPASSSPSAANPNVREEALREALAKALTNPNATVGATSSSALSEVDSYGNGSPTDRLQFGYSPAVAAEAVAFHSRFAARDWLAARKRNARLVFAKKQKLSCLNCEPVTSILKLQRHWKKTNAFQSEVRGGKSRLKAEDLDQLLDMLASKQRIGEDE